MLDPHTRTCSTSALAPQLTRPGGSSWLDASARSCRAEWRVKAQLNTRVSKSIHLACHASIKLAKGALPQFPANDLDGLKQACQMPLSEDPKDARQHKPPNKGLCSKLYRPQPVPCLRPPAPATSFARLGALSNTRSYNIL